MYEFKHVPSINGLPDANSSFDIASLEGHAVMKFSECPKFLTLVRHTDLAETSPIHCVKFKSGEDELFEVPRQVFLFKRTAGGHQFSVVHVVTQNKEDYWLIVDERTRMGFLLPYHLLNEHGEPLVQREDILSTGSSNN